VCLVPRDGAVGYVHHIVGRDRHAAGKRERTTSQNSVGSRIVEQDLDHVAVGNLTLDSIRVRKQLRGVEVAITSEGAAVDWPHTESPTVIGVFHGSSRLASAGSSR
jgi:hypothetical protein